MRDLCNPRADGVGGVSQEAIAPGKIATLRFVAYPPGTHWIHGHTMRGAIWANLRIPLIVREAPQDNKEETPESQHVLLITDSFSAQHTMDDMRAQTASGPSVQNYPNAYIRWAPHRNNGRDHFVNGMVDVEDARLRLIKADTQRPDHAV